MSYVLAFIASSIVVVLAGTALARYADDIADVTKRGRLWIGSVLLAGAMSLPELTTDISAVRFGAADLATLDILERHRAAVLCHDRTEDRETEAGAPALEIRREFDLGTGSSRHRSAQELRHGVR